MLKRRTKGIIAIICIVAINVVVGCARNSNAVSDTNNAQGEQSVGEISNTQGGQSAEDANKAQEEIPTGESDIAFSKALTMEEVISRFNLGTLGEMDFTVYENMEREDLNDALNYYLNFYLDYNGEEYRVGVSCWYENDEIAGIYLTRMSDNESCILYSGKERYHAVESIDEFLNTKTQISDWLTIELPDGYSLSEYNANVGNAGGALIEPQAYEVRGEDTYGHYVVDWTMSGCIGSIYGAQEVFVFENGKLADKQMHLWNHTSEEKIEILEGLDKSAILYHINHDLYTAGDIGGLEAQGIKIEPEDMTSDYWYIFFAEEGEDKAYYLALDQRQFTKAEAVEIARTVKFTQTQSDGNVMKAVPTEVFDKSVNDLKGVSMEVISASPASANLEILNTTDLNIQYGSDYDLQILQNGEWYSLSYLIDNWAFTAEAYTALKNISSEFSINWEIFHGTLSAGDYRIVKPINDFRGTGDFTTYYLAAEFSIN